MSTTDFASRMNKKLGGNFVVPANELLIGRRYTTGSLAWDAAMGGGYLENQWAEVIGPASAGKTATTFKCIAANQALDPGFSTLWVAGEHFDVEQAMALGVDLDRVTVVRTQIMEHALETMIDGTDSREFDLVALDSYPALLPSDEGEKGMDEFTVASGAKILNKFIRKVGPASTRAINGTERPFFGIIINQWRDQIGGFSRFGTPKITPGGKGKDYFFYARLELSRDGDYITEKVPGTPDPRKVGQTIKMKTIKNKGAAPQQVASVDFYFTDAPNLGFRRGEYDVAKEYVEIGMSMGLITRAGAYYRYSGEQWQGKDALTSAMRGDTLLQDKLRREVILASSDMNKLETMEG